MRWPGFITRMSLKPGSRGIASALPMSPPIFGFFFVEHLHQVRNAVILLRHCCLQRSVFSECLNKIHHRLKMNRSRQKALVGTVSLSQHHADGLWRMGLDCGSSNSILAPDSTNDSHSYRVTFSAQLINVAAITAAAELALELLGCKWSRRQQQTRVQAMRAYEDSWLG